jgi:hypothetical protein
MPRKAEAVRAARPEKIAAFRVGISAESRAAAYLVAKGYRILARRWKSPRGESTSSRVGTSLLYSSR